MRNRPGVVVALAVVLLLVLSAAGCGATQFEGSDVGFYPRGTSYEGAWEYKAWLYVETRDSGTMARLQDKTVWLRVEDRDGRLLLDERLEMRACKVRGTAEWESLDRLVVRLSESGIERATGETELLDDPYSVELARSGPRELMTLTFRYNSQTARYERVE
ncbi:MAG: hypothetical protein ACYC5F_11015 [Thermoleophilia bacterium]